MGVCGGPDARDSGEPPKLWRDCLALLNKSLARPTPLLLRFFSPVGVLDMSSDLRVGLRMSWPTSSLLSWVEPLWFAEFGLIVLSLGPSTATGLVIESLPLPLELPNILLSKPPCPDRLLRLFAARLVDCLDVALLIYCGYGVEVRRLVFNGCISSCGDVARKWPRDMPRLSRSLFVVRD